MYPTIHPSYFALDRPSSARIIDDRYSFPLHFGWFQFARNRRDHKGQSASWSVGCRRVSLDSNITDDENFFVRKRCFHFRFLCTQWSLKLYPRFMPWKTVPACWENQARYQYFQPLIHSQQQWHRWSCTSGNLGSDRKVALLTLVLI